jgi:hypothetical protein
LQGQPTQPKEKTETIVKEARAKPRLTEFGRHLSMTLDFDWLGLNAFGPDDLLHEITDHSRITTEFKLT